jgi:hypothetical protein
LPPKNAGRQVLVPAGRLRFDVFAQGRIALFSPPL